MKENTKNEFEVAANHRVISTMLFLKEKWFVISLYNLKCFKILAPFKQKIGYSDLLISSQKIVTHFIH